MRPKSDSIVFGAVLVAVDGENVELLEDSKYEVQLRVVSNAGRDSGRFLSKSRKKVPDPEAREASSSKRARVRSLPMTKNPTPKEILTDGLLECIPESESVKNPVSKFYIINYSN